MVHTRMFTFSLLDYKWALMLGYRFANTTEKYRHFLTLESGETGKHESPNTPEVYFTKQDLKYSTKTKDPNSPREDMEDNVDVTHTPPGYTSTPKPRLHNKEMVDCTVIRIRTTENRVKVNNQTSTKQQEERGQSTTNRTANRQP